MGSNGRGALTHTRGSLLIARSKHALIILAALVYLQVSLITAQTLYCVRVGDGSLRLSIELRVTCFEGLHLWVTPLAVLVALVLCLGFPLLSVVVAVHTFQRIKRHELASVDATIEAYGFLLRGLRPRYLWFRALQFLITLAFVAEAVFVPSGKARIFAIVAHFSISVLLVGLLDPFLESWRSFLSIASGGASGAQILYFLFLEDRTLFGIGVTIQIACVLLAFAAVSLRLFLRRRTQNKVSPNRSVTLDPVLLADSSDSSSSSSSSSSSAPRRLSSTSSSSSSTLDERESPQARRRKKNKSRSELVDTQALISLVNLETEVSTQAPQALTRKTAKSMAALNPPRVSVSPADFRSSRSTASSRPLSRKQSARHLGRAPLVSR